MRVLVVASEAYPLIKTGGLADVAGALPAALRRLGVDARILVPAYPGVLDKLIEPGVAHGLGDILGVGPSRLIEGRMPDTGVPVWLLDCPALFDRPGGPYQRPDGSEHPDNFLRFALLSRVAALIGTGEALAEWSADIVHASDWQTGLVPAYLKLAGRQAPRTVFTIHNLHFAGLFGPEILAPVGLPPHAFSIHGLEFNGLVSMLKAGLYYADRLTTVSPTYAWEITTPEGGRGFDGLLSGRARAGQFQGILNGVDYDLWDPRNDPDIAMPYGPETVAEGKAACKAALQRELDLDERPDAPMLGLVSRFSDQKGIDLVAAAASHLIDAGAQLAVLGSGDWALEQQFLNLSRRYPGRIAVQTTYNEPLSHRIQAASDIFLVPSRFEPCGLTQLYALRYGALPLVRRTGGLADTVRDMSDEWSGTGFLFDSPSSEGLLSAFYRALSIYGRPDALHYARQRAMAQDFGWHRAADAYVDLYEETLRG
ncbi:MAG: glycogen synthase GlgA [Rhodospirillaceae bacterium]